MNAPDLIADYYRRDLAEAEEDALSAQLQASPEAAERFAALAAADYKRFGLAEPGEPGTGAARRFGGPLLLVLGAAALLSYSLRDEAVRVVAVPEASEDMQPLSRPQAAAPAKVDEEDAAPPASAASVSTVRLYVSAQSADGPFHARVEGADAQGLGVFDAQGRKIAPLRASGPRDMAWDGRDAHGQAVLPGRYALAVQAGGRVLRQWVEIDVR